MADGGAADRRAEGGGDSGGGEYGSEGARDGSGGAGRAGVFLDGGVDEQQGGGPVGVEPGEGLGVEPGDGVPHDGGGPGDFQGVEDGGDPVGLAGGGGRSGGGLGEAVSGAVEADDRTVPGEERDDGVPVEPAQAESRAQHADGPRAVDEDVVGDAADPAEPLEGHGVSSGAVVARE